jgi:hypothetical protein
VILVLRVISAFKEPQGFQVLKARQASKVLLEYKVKRESVVPPEFREGLVSVLPERKESRDLLEDLKVQQDFKERPASGAWMDRQAPQEARKDPQVSRDLRVWRVCRVSPASMVSLGLKEILAPMASRARQVNKDLPASTVLQVSKVFKVTQVFREQPVSRAQLV